MSTVEERIVHMTFDNKAFETGAAQTMRTLESLNKGLSLTGATKGLNDLGAASKSVSLDHISAGVDAIVSKFKALSIIGITALTNIANKAVDAGITLVKSLTIDPVKTGLREYETNLNSIQTILANTGLEGEQGLAKVTQALDLLNHYSDQTIYNFSEMARNIGTFTAAGVTLDVATNAIKGIANLAAISGSSAEQASAAMYQLSQAISAGRLTLEDWNSVVNAGMGGKVFQQSLMETARVHGVAIDKMIKDEGSFRLTLQKGWLTSDILTETLSKFTGDLNAQQLKTMGYSEMQIAGILKMAKTAQDAATKIKTASQLINTLQESAVSGWSQTWALVLGDFNEAKELFTDINDVIGGFINASSEARNKVIQDWSDLGGRTLLIETLGRAFHILLDVLRPVRDAFRQIFPATTGQDLFNLTKALSDFVKSLKVGSDTADKIRRSFAGVFAIFGIGWDIVKEVAKTLFELFGMVGKGTGGFLSVTAAIGDFLVALRQAIKDGSVIEKVFDRIGKVLAVPIQLLQMLAHWIGKVFDRFDGGETANNIADAVAKMSPLAKLGDAIINGWAKIPDILSEVWSKLWPFADKIGEFFSNLGDFIADGLGDVDFTAIFAGLNATAFAAVLLAIRNLIAGFGKNPGSGFLDTITDSIDQLNDTLATMQNTLRAATLLEIALAVAAITVSVVALSKIDAAGLTRALTAITVMFGQLFGAMIVLEKFIDGDDILNMAGLAVTMILLATALNILASAVKKLADLDWNGLAKGLTGTVVLLGALTGALHLMPDSKKLIASSVGLILLSTAVRILVGAVTDLSGLDWEEMAKGLVGTAALLGALGLFAKFGTADKAGVLQGLGIILLATGIKILASALEDLSGMSWMEIARGLTAMAGGLLLIANALILIPPTAPLSAAGVAIIAGALLLIGTAMEQMSGLSWMEIARGMTAMAGALLLIGAALVLIPPSSILSAASIVIVAIALGKVADALEQMGKMKWSEIAKSLVLLAGSLAIIAAAMLLMEGALLGAAALLVVAASLAVLAPVLVIFGHMSWEEIGKGLVMLAGALTVIGLAGLLLTPVIPSLIGLGLAITLLGVGMLAAGAGVLLFATGLTALSIAGVAGTAALVGIVAALAGLIPLVLTELGEGLIAFAAVIATAGPKFTEAIVVVILAIVSAINITGPKIIETMGRMLLMLLETMLKYTPKLVDTGIKFVIAILEGITKNIGKMVTVATDLIVAFLGALGKNIPKVTQAGVQLIINYLNGIASAIRNNSDQMTDAGLNVASAIIEGMAKGLSKGSSRITAAARDVAKKALDAAMNFLGINSPSKKFIEVGESTNEGFALGITRSVSMVTNATEKVGQTAIDSLSDVLKSVGDVVSSDINLAPTITPVLDLSSVKKNTTELEGMFNAAPPIKVDTSYSTARTVAAAYENNRANDGMDPTSGGHSESVTFNQYNTSPKALSDGEIYRQTNNLLSKKGGFASVVD